MELVNGRRDKRRAVDYGQFGACGFVRQAVWRYCVRNDDAVKDRIGEYPVGLACKQAMCGRGVDRYGSLLTTSAGGALHCGAGGNHVIINDCCTPLYVPVYFFGAGHNVL